MIVVSKSSAPLLVPPDAFSHPPRHARTTGPEARDEQVVCVCVRVVRCGATSRPRALHRTRTAGVLGPPEVELVPAAALKARALVPPVSGEPDEV